MHCTRALSNPSLLRNRLELLACEMLTSPFAPSASGERKEVDRSRKLGAGKINY